MGNAQSLPDHIAAMPVKEVNRSTKNMLAQKLDPPSIGYNQNMVMQDWSGLAELMQLDPEEIDVYEKAIDSKEAKTLGILKKWSFQPGSNVGKLCQLIEELERHDILSDERILNRLEHDYESYKARRLQQEKEDEMYQDKMKEHLHPIQVPEITSDHQDIIDQKDRDYNEMKHIVVDDVMQPHKPQVIYDAFVSYCSADMDFVQEMIDMVENQHGLRLCVNARDLLPGVSKHYVTAKLIADRCRKVILVMSPDFINSSECEFQVKIALSLSPGAKQKILIPIVYRPCKIPLVLQHVCTVDFTKADIADWFWMRLAASLREAHVSVTRQLTFDESISLQKVELELLPDTDIESAKGREKELPLAQAPRVPRFKTQQDRPAFAVPKLPENVNQNNSAEKKEDTEVATKHEANHQDFNQLDKHSDNAQKKKKEKRGFFQRKDKNKSKESSSNGSKEENVESMEYKENTFGYISGENNEDLEGLPPRDITTAGPQKMERLQGRGPPDSSSPVTNTTTVKNVPPSTKSRMINHPMFSTVRKALTTLTPKTKRNTKLDSTQRKQVSVSTDVSSSAMTSQTESNGSTLKSYSESELTSLSRSVRESPLRQENAKGNGLVNGNNAGPAGNRVNNHGYYGRNPGANVNNYFPNNVPNAVDSGSMHLPSSSIDTDAGKRRVETSMEGMEGSMNTSMGRSSRGVCLPPPMIERPNYDIEQCTTTTTTNTDYSQNTSHGSSQTPSEMGLYTLDSNDIQLPAMSISDEHNDRPRKFINTSAADQSQERTHEATNQSYSRSDNNFDHDNHALESLGMSNFVFNFNGHSTGNGLVDSDKSGIQLPPPFVDPTLDYKADEDSMSIDPEFSESVSTIRSLFPSSVSSGSSSQRKAMSK